MQKLLRMLGAHGTRNVITDPVSPLNAHPSTKILSWLFMTSISLYGRFPLRHKTCQSTALPTPLAVIIHAVRSRHRDPVLFLSLKLTELMFGTSSTSRISLLWQLISQPAPSLISGSSMSRTWRRRRPNSSWLMVTRPRVLSTCTRFLET